MKKIIIFIKYIIQTLLNPQPLDDAHLYGIIPGKGIVRQFKQHKGKKASQQEKSWRTELNLPSKEFEKVVSITDLLYSKINNKKLFSQKTL